MAGSIVQKLVQKHRFQDDSFTSHCHPKIKSFYEYWLSKCPEEGKLPGRQDISPEEMVPYLPGIIIVERDEEKALRYRLVGTMEVELRGKNPTGDLVDDSYYATDEYRALDNYNLVLDTGRLLYDYDEILDHRDVHLLDEALFLPLAEDHVTPNMVIVYAAVRYASDDRDFEGR